MVVEYIASSPDGSGRVYARQACVQLLPRSVRLLVYGRTHKEIDMSGAHYEIDRRLVQSPTLPPIDVLREQLRRVWHGHVEELLNVEVKRFPIRIINAGVAATVRHLNAKGLQVPPIIEAVAYELAAAREVVTKEILPRTRPDLWCNESNKHYFALEAVESQFMVTFLTEV